MSPSLITVFIYTWLITVLASADDFHYIQKLSTISDMDKTKLIAPISEPSPSETDKNKNLDINTDTANNKNKTVNIELENIVVNLTESPQNKLEDNFSARKTTNAPKSQTRLDLKYNGTVGLESILRMLNAEILVDQWGELQKVVSGECKDDMQRYIRGLQDMELWALKMEDASGRYPSMFYWGNNYWTGSAELCQILNERNVPVQQRNQSTSRLFGEWRQGISATALDLPFRTAYYSVHMSIVADVPEIIKSQRTIYVGMCLPYSCSRQQVAELVTTVRAPVLLQTVLNVRSPDHATYSYFNDPIVFILICVSVVVGLLLVAGTVYDVKLAKEMSCRRQRMVSMAVDGAADGMETNGKFKYNVSKFNSEQKLTVDTTPGDEVPQLSLKSKLLLSFSVRANVLQIFDQSVGDDTLSAVHGLRTIFIVWIVLGHTCAILFKYTDNMGMKAMLEKHIWFQIIPSSVYSVDTFFCLSGVLVAFLYFRKHAKGQLDRLTIDRFKFSDSLLQFLGLSFYRFARLTAPYMFILGVVTVTAKWGADHGVFDPPLPDDKTCPRYWWRNLLYINTLFPSDEMCMLWSWYLANDALFYTIGAVMLILATSHFKLSAVLSALLLISSMLTTGYVSWTNDQVPDTDDPFTQFDKVYDKPWTRFGPYLVGMFTGWLLFKTDLQIQMRKIWAALGWVVCVSVLLVLVFGLYETKLNVDTGAIYNALSHSMWAACISWIIIACSTGHGAWVRWVLSAPIFYPFSRVTYCTYLVHPVILHYFGMLSTYPIHLSKMYAIIFFLGLMALSFFLGFVLSVAIEAPVITMLRLLAPQKRPRRV